MLCWPFPSFIFLNALLALSVLFVLFNSCMGAIRLENVSDLIRSCRQVSRNCLIHTKRPMRLCRAFFVVGGSISLMVRTYSGSALNPSLAHYPSEARKVHFSRLSLSPNLRKAAKSCSRASMYSQYVLAWTRLSSIYDVMFDHADTVARASATHLENICPADVRPKASRVTFILPSKCCFVAIAFIDLYLPISAAEVESVKIFIALSDFVE